VAPGPPVWLGDIPYIGHRLEVLWIKATSDVAGTIEVLRPRIREALLWLLSRLLASTLMLLQAAFAIILSAVFLVNARRMRDFLLIFVDKLGVSDSAGMLKTVEITTRSISKGILGTACIQAALAWAGFAVVGAPVPILLAFICLILCSIQLGIMLIGLPVAIWLWSGDHWQAAIFILIWSVFVSVIDNVIKPILLGRGYLVPIWVLFMGIIGGMLAMGLIGLFIGPIILSVAYQLLIHWTDGEGAAVDKRRAPL
jgi:predicted PurR-regulated permease PerM